jgi:Tetratricopeptide repeat
VSDGRSEPRNPKKRIERAAGGPPRRASDGARRRASEPRQGSGGPHPKRDERRREEPEPGFGPFRGRQREGTPGAGRGRKRVEDEARTVRSAAEEAVARASGEERPALRIVHRADDGEAGKPKGGQPGKGRGTRKGAPAGAPPTPRPKPVRDGGRLQEAITRGGRALDRGYEREALRILRPYRDVHPDSPDLRELLGLTYYRLGRWSMAQKELEAFVALTGSTEQHPVLMDCARALGRFKRVETLWEELRAASPAAEVVTEGRIVAAGALADRGLLDEAIKVLERAPGNPKRILPHHLRLWYALADLQERAGDIPAARALFRKVSAQDPQFVDVAERLAALS